MEENCTGADGTADGSPDWQSLLRETEAFARWQIARHHWRGERGGVLPDGYDGSAIAAEAVREVLREEAETDGGIVPKQNGEFTAFKGREKGRGRGRGRLEEGGLQWRLNRWVFRIVGRLNHRKETKAMRNDLDLPLQAWGDKVNYSKDQPFSFYDLYGPFPFSFLAPLGKA
jgi:hypothetical protein